eukprot:EG_transcript_26930
MYWMYGVQPQQSPSPNIIPNNITDICLVPEIIVVGGPPRFVGCGNYSNNRDCQVVLQGATLSSLGWIVLTVLPLSTDPVADNFLEVHDGPTANGTLLATSHGTGYNGSTMQSTGTSLTVRCTSDGSATGAGWLLAYSLVEQDDICNAAWITADSYPKYLSRGNYSNNEDCRVVLHAYSPGRIEVKLLSLSTEQGLDVLAVYDGPTANGTLLGSWSGNVSGGVAVRSRGSSVTVR